MSIREAINKRKGLAVVIAILLTSAGMAAILWMNRNSGYPAALSELYFSDDDGKSYFVDNATKLVPFDHNGKQAVRAYVFTTDNGKPFVARLQRYSDDALRRILVLRDKKGDIQSETELAEVMAKGLQIKRPGDAAWVAANSPMAAKISDINAPNGSAPHEIVP